MPYARCLSLLAINYGFPDRHADCLQLKSARQLLIVIRLFLSGKLLAFASSLDSVTNDDTSLASNERRRPTAAYRALLTSYRFILQQRDDK